MPLQHAACRCVKGGVIMYRRMRSFTSSPPGPPGPKASGLQANSSMLSIQLSKLHRMVEPDSATLVGNDLIRLILLPVTRASLPSGTARGKE